MGIKGLFKVLSDNAPSAIKTVDYTQISGRKVAIDASMSLYQFLVAVRQNNGEALSGVDGESTSHLIGIFYRTIRLVEHGLKPVYVFEGKAPDMKGGTLGKRKEARDAAEAARDAAENEADRQKFERRLVRVSPQQNEDAKRLLELMGIPVIVAPTEAEAQCAALAAKGKVWASGTEDMDTLTFGTPILIRHLNAGDQKKNPMIEINLAKALEELKFTTKEFIDMCILLGCDYCEPVKGMGPQTVLKLMNEFRSIEAIKEHLKEKGGKVQIPDDWPFERVRELFVNPEVTDPAEVEFKWEKPNEDELIKFLVDKGFDETRVRNGTEKLLKGSKSVPQGRLTDFFSVKRVAKDDPKAKKKSKK